MLDALKLAHESMQPVIKLIEEMRAAVGKPKNEVASYLPAKEVQAKVTEEAHAKVTELLAAGLDKHALKDSLTEVREAVEESIFDFMGLDEAAGLDISDAMDVVIKEATRRRILEQGLRPDGRDTTTIRPIRIQVGKVPRVHGSGLFMRGETHVLSIATLGTPGDAQKLDTLQPEDEKRYIHHYNFPPYSTGEAYPLRGPKRREIGHGALAERALVPVIPDDFPYTLRVVSEVVSSNGSTSMASVCGSTLALMDGGVPITAPVAGIAMGLVQDMATGDYKVLSDIQGMEDALGDMDFKVAGTAHGITALQMDLKIKGLDFKILREALDQARTGRLFILAKMLETLPESRAYLRPYAPRILTLTIDPEKIGKLIGPGGKTIRGLQESFGVKIDVEEDGTVFISGEGVGAEQCFDEVSIIFYDLEFC